MFSLILSYPQTRVSTTYVSVNINIISVMFHCPQLLSLNPFEVNQIKDEFMQKNSSSSRCVNI